jgi:hypothetical protein
MVNIGCKGYQGKTGKDFSIAAQKTGERNASWQCRQWSACTAVVLPFSSARSCALVPQLGGSCSPVVMEPKADRLDTRKCLAVVACQQAGKYGKLRNDLWLMRVRGQGNARGGSANGQPESPTVTHRSQ